MKTLNDLHSVPDTKLTHESIAALERQMLAILQDSASFNSLAPCLAVTAARYHLSTGGQRVRALLALHAGKCLGLKPEVTHGLAAVCELLHNASLIHDDLHDRDTHRRNQPSVWYQFGDEVAVCAGDLLLSASYLALSQIVDVPRLPQLFALVHARIASAVRGQCAELGVPQHQHWTVEDFKSIALSKSGALLSLPTELALMAAQQDQAVARAHQAAMSFAVAYQIHDDLADAPADAARHLFSKLAGQPRAGLGACNIVLILQSDPHCADARAEAKQMALRHLCLSASACAELPFNSGAALHALCIQLKDALEYLE